MCAGSGEQASVRLCRWWNPMEPVASGEWRAPSRRVWVRVRVWVRAEI